MPHPPPPSSSASTTSLNFYPAYTYTSSPTYFTWVKLTAFQIHHILRPHPFYTTSSGSSLLLFYLNHPIQFVQIVGPVVAIEDHHEKFQSITIDDGSGECMECIAWRPVKQPIQEDVAGGSVHKETPVNEDHLNRDAILTILDVGSVVSAKGSISVFRGLRQLQLERLSVLGDTNAEMAAIAARTRFLEKVLMRPWVVSSAKQRKLLKEAQAETATAGKRVKDKRDREKRFAEREKRHAEEIMRQWEAEETERQRVADEARTAGEDVHRSINAQREMLEMEKKQREEEADELDVLAY